MKLKEIAGHVEGRVVGSPDIDITGVSGLEDARKGDITFLADKKNLKYVYDTGASALITREEIKDLSLSMIIVENPTLAFAKTLDIFYNQPPQPLGVSEKACIGIDVHIGSDVSIYPLAFIGNNVSIGNRATIFPNLYIGDRTSIGDDVKIHPNVTIRENVKIGNNVTIHPGTVVGSDGFGYVQEKEKHRKIQQVGGVIIGDDVEIGANVTIDRATTGMTEIGSGTKIDNLVQVAHNVKIGKNCVLVAQVAIGGSVHISDGAILAGQVGVRDHTKIGKGVMIGAQSGVGHDIPDGMVFSGTPAIPHKTWMRSQSIFAKLPEYIRRLQDLERKMKKEE
jgi:UDP-3-O-[3-hydroxymyristoyl] glucosamine N-acyltransferase